MKICTKCKSKQSYESFHADRRTRDGLSYKCKQCKSEYDGKPSSILRRIKYNRLHQSQISEYHSKYYDIKADHKANLKMKIQYNITLTDYNRMLNTHNGACAICHMDNGPRRLHIDHDNTEGLVRGLLCNNCNLGIGYLKENHTIFLGAIQYLKLDEPLGAY